MFKKVISFLLILSFIAPIVAQAQCEKAVTFLDKGTSAPCRGYLFSPEKEQEVYLMSEEHKIMKQELELKNKKIDNLFNDIKYADFIIKKEQEQSELWRKAAEDSTLQLVKKQETQGKRDFMMMLLGVVVTVGAGYAVGQAGR